jgi:gliding motility-associated-like protein
LCFGNSSGSITASGTGGIGPYEYSIDGGSYQASGVFPGLTAGTHTIGVKDSKDCTFSIDVVISGPAAALSGNITAQGDVSCFGLTNGSFTIAGNGGMAPYSFSLDGGAYQPSGVFTGIAAGSYTITVRDANLCTFDVQAVVTEPSAIDVTFTKEDATCPGEEQGSITLTITGGLPPYNVIWSDGPTTPNRDNLTDTTYSAIVRDVNGCPVPVEVTIGFTGSNNCIEINEIITPNADGHNDTWKIKNIDLFPNAEVFVFNRWGKLVFHSRNISADEWDGTFKGKALPTDSYHYILHLNDGSEPRSGVVSIIR